MVSLLLCAAAMLCKEQGITVLVWFLFSLQSFLSEFVISLNPTKPEIYVNYFDNWINYIDFNPIIVVLHVWQMPKIIFIADLYTF